MLPTLPLPLSLRARLSGLGTWDPRGGPVSLAQCVAYIPCQPGAMCGLIWHRESAAQGELRRARKCKQELAGRVSLGPSPSVPPSSLDARPNKGSMPNIESAEVHQESRQDRQMCREMLRLIEDKDGRLQALHFPGLVLWGPGMFTLLGVPPVWGRPSPPPHIVRPLCALQ